MLIAQPKLRFNTLLVVALLFALGGNAIPTVIAATAETDKDPFLWLEDVSGKKALDWVRSENAVSTKILEASPDFAPMQAKLINILESKERIPNVEKYGKFYYNFWRDDKNVRGLWRRTTLEEYKKENPAWETVLDLDKLAESEKENWVWEGPDVLYHDYDRALIQLSRGGADAKVVREFDLNSKSFVKNGFTLSAGAIETVFMSVPILGPAP